MWIFVDDNHLDFSIYDAMRGLRLGKRRRERLDEEARRMIAAAILERLRQSGWRVVREDRPWHSSPGSGD